MSTLPPPIGVRGCAEFVWRNFLGKVKLPAGVWWNASPQLRILSRKWRQKFVLNLCSFYFRITLMQQKKVLFEWIFLSKKFCCDPKKIPSWAENIAFPPLNYDQKVEFWPFWACCVQHCSHSRASTLVQLASLESSDPFYVDGSTRKSLWGPGDTIQEHLL